MAVALWLLAVVLAAPVWAQPSSGSSDGAAVADAGSPAIAPADIPSRADADEKFIQAVQRRAQMTDKVRRLEQTLSRQSASLDQLSQVTDSNDLSQLSVQRLESLERHWQLKDRALNQTRADIARATNMASEDAAELAVLRTAWQATAAQPNLSPALVQRADELVTQIDAAQAMLADPLAKLLDLGRKGNALSTQLQKGVSDVVREVADQDRRLVTMDSLPLWQAIREADMLEPVGSGMRRNLEIESAFARDFDAAHARLLPVLGAFALLLLPAIFWLRRRAKALVAAGQLGDAALQALSRPWAAWLLLVAAGAALYGFQGPGLRQQGVMLLAWIPVLGLLQRRLLNVVGPWAYLSAIFYFLNVVVSLLVGNPVLYRVLLLALNLLMLATLVWHLVREHRSSSGEDGEVRFQAGTWHVVAWAACIVLAVAALSNFFGNVSLSAMLVSATLASSYVALAMYAGSKVALALLQVSAGRAHRGEAVGTLCGLAGAGGGQHRAHAAGAGLAAVHAAVLPHLPSGVGLRRHRAHSRVHDSANCRSAWAAWCPSRWPPGPRSGWPRPSARCWPRTSCQVCRCRAAWATACPR